MGNAPGLALEELRGKIDTEMESYKQAEGYLDAYMQPLILEPSDTLSYDEFQEEDGADLPDIRTWFGL